MLSPMQIKFLNFAVHDTVYGFNGHANSRLPCRGAVAKTINDSLRKRGLINNDGLITQTGRLALLKEMGQVLVRA